MGHDFKAAPSIFEYPELLALLQEVFESLQKIYGLRPLGELAPFVSLTPKGSRPELRLCSELSPDGSFYAEISLPEDLGPRCLDLLKEGRWECEELNTLCVIVEEISHFTLFAHKVSAQMPLSLLELEWQAEVDKFLLCRHILSERFGPLCPHALAHWIYDHSLCTAELSQRALYEDSLRMAARFVFKNLGSPNGLLLSTKKAYMQSWGEKLRICA